MRMCAGLGAGLVLLAAELLAACSQAATIYILNNTSAPISIVEVKSELENKVFENKTVKHKEGFDTRVSFEFEDVVSVKIVAGGCLYFYIADVPLSIPRNDGKYFMIRHKKLQIEPDFRAWMIPEDSKGAVDVTLYADDQPEGFPLSPAANTCTSG